MITTPSLQSDYADFEWLIRYGKDSSSFGQSNSGGSSESSSSGSSFGQSDGSSSPTPKPSEPSEPKNETGEGVFDRMEEEHNEEPSQAETAATSGGQGDAPFMMIGNYKYELVQKGKNAGKYIFAFTLPNGQKVCREYFEDKKTANILASKGEEFDPYKETIGQRRITDDDYNSMRSEWAQRAQTQSTGPKLPKGYENMPPLAQEWYRTGKILNGQYSIANGGPARDVASIAAKMAKLPRDSYEWRQANNDLVARMANGINDPDGSVDLQPFRDALIPYKTADALGLAKRYRFRPEGATKDDAYYDLVKNSVALQEALVEYGNNFDKTFVHTYTSQIPKETYLVDDLREKVMEAGRQALSGNTSLTGPVTDTINDAIVGTQEEPSETETGIEEEQSEQSSEETVTPVGARDIDAIKAVLQQSTIEPDRMASLFKGNQLSQKTVSRQIKERGLTPEKSTYTAQDLLKTIWVRGNLSESTSNKMLALAQAKRTGDIASAREVLHDIWETRSNTFARAFVHHGDSDLLSTTFGIDIQKYGIRGFSQADRAYMTELASMSSGDLERLAATEMSKASEIRRLFDNGVLANPWEMAEETEAEPDETDAGAFEALRRDGEAINWIDTLNVAQPGVLKASQIHVHPEDYQYKSGTNKEGAVESWLQGRTFHPGLAETIDVWKDPDTGEYVCINGHHRLALAKQSNYGGDLPVWIHDVRTKDEARVLGALLNIQQRKGTAVDAATVLREMDLPKEVRDALGFDEENSIGTQAMGIAQLGDTLYSQVQKGRIPAKIGFIIGACLGRKDVDNADDKQVACWKFMQKHGYDEGTPYDRLKGVALSFRNAQFAEDGSQLSFFPMLSTDAYNEAFSDLQYAVISQLRNSKTLGSLIKQKGAGAQDEGLVTGVDYNKSEDLRKAATDALRFFDEKLTYRKDFHDQYFSEQVKKFLDAQTRAGESGSDKAKSERDAIVKETVGDLLRWGGDNKSFDEWVAARSAERMGQETTESVSEPERGESGQTADEGGEETVSNGGVQSPEGEGLLTEGDREDDGNQLPEGGESGNQVQSVEEGSQEADEASLQSLGATDEQQEDNEPRRRRVPLPSRDNDSEKKDNGEAGFSWNEDYLNVEAKDGSTDTDQPSPQEAGEQIANTLSDVMNEAGIDTSEQDVEQSDSLAQKQDIETQPGTLTEEQPTMETEPDTVEQADTMPAQDEQRAQEIAQTPETDLGTEPPVTENPVEPTATEAPQIEQQPAAPSDEQAAMEVGKPAENVQPAPKPKKEPKKTEPKLSRYQNVDDWGMESQRYLNEFLKSYGEAFGDNATNSKATKQHLRDFLEGKFGSLRLGTSKFMANALRDTGIIDESGALTTLGKVIAKNIKVSIGDNADSVCLMRMNFANTPLGKYFFATAGGGLLSYDKDRFVACLVNEYNLDQKTALSVWSSLANIGKSDYGRLLGIGLEDGRLVDTFDRRPSVEAILYGLYRYGEAVDWGGFNVADLYGKDDAPSPGVVFNIDPEELRSYIRGIHIKYPDFLYCTFTHDLDVVDLKNSLTGKGNKTSESVLRELFLGEEPEEQQEESEETPQTTDIEQQPNDEDNLQSLATESEPAETEREQEPRPSEGELLAQDEEAPSNDQTEPTNEEPVQNDEQSLMGVGTEEEPEGEEEAASNVDTQKDNAGTSSNILKDGLSWTDSKADLSTEEGRAQMLEDAARKKQDLLDQMKGQKPEKTDEEQTQEIAQNDTIKDTDKEKQPREPSATLFDKDGAEKPQERSNGNQNKARSTAREFLSSGEKEEDYYYRSRSERWLGEDILYTDNPSDAIAANKELARLSQTDDELAEAIAHYADREKEAERLKDLVSQGKENDSTLREFNRETRLEKRKLNTLVGSRLRGKFRLDTSLEEQLVTDEEKAQELAKEAEKAAELERPENISDNDEKQYIQKHEQLMGSSDIETPSPDAVDSSPAYTRFRGMGGEYTLENGEFTGFAGMPYFCRKKQGIDEFQKGREWARNVLDKILASDEGARLRRAIAIADKADELGLPGYLCLNSVYDEMVKAYQKYIGLQEKEPGIWTFNIGRGEGSLELIQDKDKKTMILKVPYAPNDETWGVLSDFNRYDRRSYRRVMWDKDGTVDSIFGNTATQLGLLPRNYDLKGHYHAPEKTDTELDQWESHTSVDVRNQSKEYMEGARATAIAKYRDSALKGNTYELRNAMRDWKNTFSLEEERKLLNNPSVPENMRYSDISKPRPYSKDFETSIKMGGMLKKGTNTTTVVIPETAQFLFDIGFIDEQGNHTELGRRIDYDLAYPKEERVEARNTLRKLALQRVPLLKWMQDNFSSGTVSSKSIMAKLKKAGLSKEEAGLAIADLTAMAGYSRAFPLQQHRESSFIFYPLQDDSESAEQEKTANSVSTSQPNESEESHTDEEQLNELAKEPQAEKPIATKPEAPSDEQSLMDIPAPEPKPTPTPTPKPEPKQETKPEAKPAPVPEQPKPEQPNPAVAQKPPAEPASKPAATSPSTSTTKDDEAQFDSLARQETGDEPKKSNGRQKPKFPVRSQRAGHWSDEGRRSDLSVKGLEEDWEPGAQSIFDRVPGENEYDEDEEVPEEGVEEISKDDMRMIISDMRQATGNNLNDWGKPGGMFPPSKTGEPNKNLKDAVQSHKTLEAYILSSDKHSTPTKMMRLFVLNRLKPSFYTSRSGGAGVRSLVELGTDFDAITSNIRVESIRKNATALRDSIAAYSNKAYEYALMREAYTPLGKVQTTAAKTGVDERPEADVGLGNIAIEQYRRYLENVKAVADSKSETGPGTFLEELEAKYKTTPSVMQRIKRIPNKGRKELEAGYSDWLRSKGYEGKMVRAELLNEYVSSASPDGEGTVLDNLEKKYGVEPLPLEQRINALPKEGREEFKERYFDYVTEKEIEASEELGGALARNKIKGIRGAKSSERKQAAIDEALAREEELNPETVNWSEPNFFPTGNDDDDADDYPLFTKNGDVKPFGASWNPNEHSEKGRFTSAEINDDEAESVVGVNMNNESKTSTQTYFEDLKKDFDRMFPGLDDVNIDGDTKLPWDGTRPEDILTEEQQTAIKKKVDSQRECYERLTDPERGFPEILQIAAMYQTLQNTPVKIGTDGRTLDQFVKYPAFTETGSSNKEVKRSGKVRGEELAITPEAVFTKPWLFVYPENRAAAEEMAKEVIAQRKADKLSYAKSDEDMLFDICRGYDREQCTTDCPTLFI